MRCPLCNTETEVALALPGELRYIALLLCEPCAVLVSEINYVPPESTVDLDDIVPPVEPSRIR